MSNPLLRPNDPRFHQPELRDASGRNQFGEEGPPASQSAAASDQYAPAAGDEARPFTPRYETQQQPRTALLLLLGGLAWAAAGVGVMSLAGVFGLGWISPLLGLGPGAAGWLLAHSELKAIGLGAISADAATQTRHAYWLGLTGLLGCAAIVAAMIYRQMNVLPDVFY